MIEQRERPNILIAHPDPIVSAGLVAALSQNGTFEVYVHGVDNLGADGPLVDAVVSDYAGALRLTHTNERKAWGVRGAARILALTSNDREADIRCAIELGVQGYLLVGGPLSELIDAVASVARGVRFFSAAVAQRLADSLTREALTTREVDVLQLVVTGQPNKAIARSLRIELATVKSHMSAIMRKLGASSRTDAARIAAARGLLESACHTHQRAPASKPLSVEAAQAAL
ncbi:response regulator transcription factor [Variovorax sp. J22R133]|uniref:response regulator transcription factor n=1 Tax=Variovorax brevis TaxID=3053503 RepID=UPI002575F0F0|nr:response regulator transcription factor [Variovorax sp. J22R133]MDM0117484.1 response regulator transcription factor [Variovorax sp. J22R133]